MDEASFASQSSFRPNNTTLFGNNNFSNEELARAQDMLTKTLPKQDLSTRQGPGGSKLTYIESHKAIELANSVFLFNGWSCKIVSLTEDYVEKDDSGKWSCGVNSVVRITLKDGAYHEDVGYGSAENMKTKGIALEKARKEAISDARKRALRLFGNGLGNCVYNKTYLKNVKNGNPSMSNENSTPSVKYVPIAPSFPEPKQEYPPKPVVNNRPLPPLSNSTKEKDSLNSADTFIDEQTMSFLLEEFEEEEDTSDQVSSSTSEKRYAALNSDLSDPKRHKP